MRYYLYGLVVAGLMACESRKAATVEQQPAAPADTVSALPAQPVVVDTRIFSQPLVSQDTAEEPKFRPVQIAGEDYQLYTSAHPDRNQPLQLVTRQRINSVDSTGATVRVTQFDTLRGFDVVYQFRLRNAAGKILFNQILRKTKDFANVLGPEFTTDTDAFRPRLLAYLPAFEALAFEVGFGPDGSDVGGDLLVLLDAKTGRLRHAGIGRWFLAASNATPTLSTDGRALLTSYELLRADGGVVDFKRASGSVAGSTWLNSEALLVAYTPDSDSLERQVKMVEPSMAVLNREGKPLTTFQFDAVDGSELGYNLMYHYLPSKQEHYFYDATTGRLCIISANQPTAPKMLALRSLPRFKSPKRPNEIAVGFIGGFGGKLTLYVDTIGGSMRYQCTKSALE